MDAGCGLQPWSRDVHLRRLWILTKHGVELRELRNTPRDVLCTRNDGRMGSFTVPTSPGWRVLGSSKGSAIMLRKDGGDGVPAMPRRRYTRLGGAGLVVNPRKLIRRGNTGENGGVE